MKLIILGPPGSGKGTISEKVAREYGLLHISPGELFREEVKKNTPLGREIKQYIEQGHLLPDEFTVQVVKLEVHGKKKYILDGFPRSVAQAKAIEELKVGKVIFLEVSLAEVLKRFAGRRACPQGHTCHLQFSPPQHKGKCDIDGLPLSRRKDDQPRVIKERFKVYRKISLPVVRFYQRKKLLKKVDASGTPEEVYERVRRTLR